MLLAPQATETSSLSQTSVFHGACTSYCSCQPSAPSGHLNLVENHHWVHMQENPPTLICRGRIPLLHCASSQTLQSLRSMSCPHLSKKPPSKPSQACVRSTVASIPTGSPRCGQVRRAHVAVFTLVSNTLSPNKPCLNHSCDHKRRVSMCFAMSPSRSLVCQQMSDVPTAQDSSSSSPTFQQRIPCSMRRILTHLATAPPLLDELTEIPSNNAPSTARHAFARRLIRCVICIHMHYELGSVENLHDSVGL